MNKRMIRVAVRLVLLTCSQLLVLHAQAQVSEPAYHPHRILVKFHKDSPLFVAARQAVSREPARSVSTNSFASFDPALSSLMKNASVAEFRALKNDASLELLYGGVERIFVLELNSSITVKDAQRFLLESGECEYAEPDYIGVGAGELCAEGTNYASSPALIPNDPRFGDQWGLRNTGQLIGGVTGKSGADINIAQAWDISSGTAGLMLAVLDSGIPQNAADLEGRVNPGYDFANSDNDPTDDHGHGSNVTSIAAATGNNGTVMAGVNWNCRIVHFKILNNQNSGFYSWFASALIAAADSGARVINMSVGGTGVSATLQSAVQYASSEGTGAIITVSMMNTNNEVTYYPAAYPEVIAVGATNNLDARAVPFCYSATSGSNYGNHIDFVAPGERILGLNYLDPTQGSFWCGTSQATPMVAGLISLMRGIKPDLSFQEVYDILKASARDQIGLAAEDVAGWDKYFGWGCVDAHAALQAVSALVSAESPVESVLRLRLDQNYPNPFNPLTVISYQLSVLSRVSLRVYDILGREVATLVEGEKPAGMYKVEWNAAVPSGVSARGGYASGVYFYRLAAVGKDGRSFVVVKKMILAR